MFFRACVSHFRLRKKSSESTVQSLTGQQQSKSLMDTAVCVQLSSLISPSAFLSPGYDFAAVLEWFAERVDRIILLFDAHKLDISDEFSEVIRALKNHEDKMRVVLNKADQISTQQLMRVYGALMWSLGKIINTPEVKALVFHICASVKSTHVIKWTKFQSDSV